MSDFPSTTVKVISVTAAGDTKVRILMEMMVDVHRLAEVGGDLLRAAIEQLKSQTTDQTPEIYAAENSCVKK